MKKIFLIISFLLFSRTVRKIFFAPLFLFLFTPALLANQYQPFKEGQTLSKNLNYGYDVKIPLPSGDWIVKVVDSYRTPGAGTTVYNVGLLQVGKDKKLNQYLQVTFSAASPNYWTTPRDCSREDIYAYEKSLGNEMFNCWMVNHHRWSFSHNLTDYEKKLKDILISENIKISEIMIYSQHLFASKRSGNVYHLIKHYINPESQGIEPPAQVDWNTSEYQKIKISSYPKKKAFLDSFVSTSANFHKQFQDGIGVNKIDRIELDKYIGSNVSKINTNITGELERLERLYKSGVITKEEFEKAKNKILN
jgi:hypothetical protein